MSKIEDCWVIQRDDGVYWGDYGWTTRLSSAVKECTKERSISIIDDYNLQNCRPVKVEIRVVGE